MIIKISSNEHKIVQMYIHYDSLNEHKTAQMNMKWFKWNNSYEQKNSSK